MLSQDFNRLGLLDLSMLTREDSNVGSLNLLQGQRVAGVEEDDVTEVLRRTPSRKKCTHCPLDDTELLNFAEPGVL
jgi:hypothetical protein